MSRTIAPLVGLLLFGQSCVEYDVSSVSDVKEGGVPEILVEPPAIDFGTRSSSDPVELRQVRITNVGEELLNVSDITVADEPEFTIEAIDEWPYQIDVGDWVEFEVAFTPTRAGLIEGFAVVYSDGNNETESYVDLWGQGAIPNLIIEPNPVEFGSQFIGCDDEELVTLSNVGGEAVEVASMDFISDGQIRLEPIDEFTPPFMMDPGESVQMRLEFVPLATFATEANIVIESDDPAGDVVHVSTGSGVYVAEMVDAFEVPDNPPVDILFAVDQSCSMDDQTAGLASAFNEFIADIDNVTSGWNIGVATNDDGCFNYGVIDANTSDYASKFSSAVSSGGCLDGSPWCDTEELLRLTSTALGRTSPGQCNSGFLRPGAMLHVIVVSDEEDQSGVGWSSWVSDYEAYLASPAHLKVSAVVDVNRNCGDGTGPDGYLEAANYTGGEVLDICQNNWAGDIAALSAASLANIFTYELTMDDPDPGSIVVTVDGTEWTTDWSYDSSLNAVVFDVELDVGQEIDVSYGVLTSCP